MKDGIIKETKNSRLLKAELPATYAELVALAANAGIPADVLFNADGWQQLPTFLNKKTLLQDSTAGLLGLTEDPTVDDAFVALLLVSTQLGAVRAMVTVDGTPAKAGIEVTGIKGLDGNAVYTDSTGIAVGFAEPGEIALSTPVYQDLPSAPVIQQQLQVGEIVTVTLTIPSAPKAGDKSITTSTNNIRFSPYVTEVDVCCIGGGAGGSSQTQNTYGGTGGGQGKITNKLGIKPDSKTSYNAIVGNRGYGATCRGSNVVTHAVSGGNSSFMGVSASGGGINSGGAGVRYYDYGQSYKAEDGQSNTTRIFNDSSIPLTGGSGGGSGILTSFSQFRVGGSGGSPNGGSGATNIQSQHEYPGGDGSSFGAGGGGGYDARISISDAVRVGGHGYQGLVRFRWRVSA